jgi:outer membrane protein
MWSRPLGLPAAAAVVLSALLVLTARAADTLTLAQAEQIALRNNPKVGSSGLVAQAAEKQIAEAHAAFLPTLNGYLTGAAAEIGTALAAGVMQTSSISNRATTGVALTQMVTDFGRTSNLTQTAKLRAAAQGKNLATTRAQVILEVRQAYFQALGAESALKVAQAAVDARRTTLRQIRALVQAQVNSTLDLSFAEVAVSEAELALYQAENDSREARARLFAAMGYGDEQNSILANEGTVTPLNTDIAGFISEALQQRPDLTALQLNRDASRRFAEAERKLRYGSITASAAGGVTPEHDHTVRDNYAGAGINFTLPFLNGGLYSARYAEADLRAQAADKDVQYLTVQISRDVRIAWLEANTTFQRLSVTERLLAQANEALRLARARYQAGLGSIVELTQAELTQTSAEIGAAVAKFDYLSRRALLDYTTGALR